MWTTEVLLEAALVIVLAILFYMELKLVRIKLEHYVDCKIENMIAIFNLKNQSDRMMRDLAEFAKANVPEENKVQEKEKTKKKVK